MEVRRVSQEEDEDLYFEGEIQDFEKEWFNFSIYYEREYLEKGKLKREKIIDYDSSFDFTEDYFKYYHIASKNQSMYHTALARRLLVELFESYLGFDVIDCDYKIKQSLMIDYKKIPAYDRILKCAQSGDVLAQNELGKMYENGEGVIQDYALAQYWYQQAADKKDQFGQLNLGLLYLGGKGVQKDYLQALFWINKSVAQGNADAQTVLGEMYEKGKGVEQSFMEASNLYRKAAKQRNAVAPYKLGLMYEYGNGFDIDLKIAKRWYYQAASNFNEDAQKRLNELLSSLE